MLSQRKSSFSFLEELFIVGINSMLRLGLVDEEMLDNTIKNDQ